MHAFCALKLYHFNCAVNVHFEKLETIAWAALSEISEWARLKIEQQETYLKALDVGRRSLYRSTTLKQKNNP